VYIPSLVPAGSTDASADATQVSPTTTDELATGGWGLSWCKERWWGSVLAVFAGTSPVVKVSYLSKGILDQADLQILTLNPSPTSLIHLTPTSSSPLTSVSWAPSCGRSYHLIATGARDGAVRIWRVEPPNDGDDPEETSREGWKAEVVAEFEKGGARIGMVDVNPSFEYCSKLMKSGTQRARH
jgi:nucleoporin SEH1